MTNSETRELQARQKQEVAATGEQTKPGLVYTPDVDIFETEKEIILLADMPGVTPEKLTIDLRDDVLTLTGEASEADNPLEAPIVIEYGVGKYYRQFTLSEVVDQTNISAKMKDGVLRLTLPKVEKATPRKIKVSVE